LFKLYRKSLLFCFTPISSNTTCFRFFFCFSYGSAEQRAAAADTISQLASLMNAAALKPYAIPLVGPLIRVVADRFPAPVKTAILAALRFMLVKAGASLKPFVTQLQSTFLKALGKIEIVCFEKFELTLCVVFVSF
jgi:hypothetical protein